MTFFNEVIFAANFSQENSFSQLLSNRSILKSDRDGRFYIGSTTDLKRRLSQHQTHHTQTTDRMGNTYLVFSQEYKTLEEARFIEKRLKKLKRKDYLQKIINDGYLKMNIA